ncbi:MAG: DUF167 domain-containing protein [Alphaproteobacteria bacterium]|nr:DUF167 domain-containing protein [Alphaproteobacteria bacterium]
MFFEITTKGILLRVRLSPNSSCCKICGIYTTPDNENYLKVSVISVPEKGKANSELVSWLSKQLKIAKSDINIISGELDRYKKILITNSNEQILEKLNSFMPKE